MDDDLIPMPKEKNIFWSGVTANAIITLFGALFIGSFFYLSTQYFNYGLLPHLLIFFNSGLGLIIIMLYARSKIIPIK